MQEEQTKQQTNQQTKQQTITKQNQQNTDILTKTAPAMMQEKNEDAEFEKMLRRPRSKKKLKLYAEVDLRSMTDEEIMERMRKERASGADSSAWGSGSSVIDRRFNTLRLILHRKSQMLQEKLSV